MARIVNETAARRGFAFKPLAAIILSAGLLATSAYAVDFGHSRLLSGIGQPLRVDVPLRNLDPDDLQQLRVQPAAADEWAKLGLTPPVPLSSVQVVLVPGVDASSRVARIQSAQIFNGPIADILIDVQTARGNIRHQVSLLAQPRGTPLQPPVVTADSQAALSVSTSGPGAEPAAGAIQVRRGDTLFSIARRYATPDVTVWQVMAALYSANPQAFINNNMNLLKAGATLKVPDAASLTALSNAQAKALFHEHQQAFVDGRAISRAALQTTPAGEATASGSAGTVSRDAPGTGSAGGNQPRDQLKLSVASADAGSTDDDRLAARKNMEESGKRIADLEGNVDELKSVLQSQSSGGSAEQGGNAQSGGMGVASASGASGGSIGAADGSGSAGGGSETSASPGAEVGAAAAGVTIAPGSAAQAVAQAESEAKAAMNDQEASEESWFSKHLLWILTGLLAILVLIVAWLLRRANAKADEGETVGVGQVTEDMIQEKLERIDLELQGSDSAQPNADKTPDANPRV